MTRVAIGGIIAILLFDLIASLASTQFGFPYAWASIGSFAIYVTIGFFAARSAAIRPVRLAALAAATTGFAEASVGWWISSQLGANKSADGVQLTVAVWMFTALFVIVVAAGLGALGGLMGRRKTV